MDDPIETQTIHPAHHGWNEVVVTVDSQVAQDDMSPEAIRVDLMPAE